ncbi:TRAP transporter substrate-binding protein [Methylobacterium isbiliense]|jgi:tripartite ATP-independent transporter DctP family solute receptor|uniref:Solute-binding protein n=1 Tax=Methylobacterium isbiliense TaxID=315478 RepID=A0ABQ4SQC2_9HYPH|nr:DctP family TRAP transporter solute-binding subunit [Methylobacterium isbiliense]MDN3625252.1 TRAP transporter substrate-binding protein [Methylobacterium isbiliense]GJE04008.1 Solute-binding protein [Methylobacterium isbiliense]
MLSRRSLFATLAASTAAFAMPHIARAATRKLRLGHNNSPTSITQAHADAFAKAAASLSDGRLAIDIFPSSQLGNEQQMLKAVAEGTLDLTLAPAGVTSPYSSETILVELPFLFPNAAAARAALAGPLGQHCSDLLKPKGIVNLGWGEIGLRNFTANKPIRTVADIQGLKLRVPLAPPILKTFQALGAAAETLPFPQLREALRTGRFEAQENPIAQIIAGEMYTVQSHVSLTRHVYTSSLLAFSADVAEEMSPADLDVLRKAAVIGTKASQDYSDVADVKGLTKLRESGMTVVEDVDRAGFQAAVAAVQGKLAEIFGGDAMRQIRSLVG